MFGIDFSILELYTNIYFDKNLYSNYYACDRKNKFLIKKKPFEIVHFHVFLTDRACLWSLCCQKLNDVQNGFISFLQSGDFSVNQDCIRK